MSLFHVPFARHVRTASSVCRRALGRSRLCIYTAVSSKRSVTVTRQVCVSAVRALGCLAFCVGIQAGSPSETTMWCDTAATNFTQSTPLGNGRLGAMVFGGIDEERIILNESSVWSGSRQDADRSDAYKVLPEIQKLLLDG